eukprot:349741-Chlamydomonas_euryale.AAC.11
MAPIAADRNVWLQRPVDKSRPGIMTGRAHALRRRRQRAGRRHGCARRSRGLPRLSACSAAALAMRSGGAACVARCGRRRDRSAAPATGRRASARPLPAAQLSPPAVGRYAAPHRGRSVVAADGRDGGGGDRSRAKLRDGSIGPANECAATTRDRQSGGAHNCLRCGPTAPRRTRAPVVAAAAAAAPKSGERRFAVLMTCLDRQRVATLIRRPPLSHAREGGDVVPTLTSSLPFSGATSPR